MKVFKGYIESLSHQNRKRNKFLRKWLEKSLKAHLVRATTSLSKKWEGSTKTPWASLHWRGDVVLLVLLDNLQLRFHSFWRRSLWILNTWDMSRWRRSWSWTKDSRDSSTFCENDLTIAVSGPTEHCPIFHFPPSSVLRPPSVTGVTYQLFSICWQLRTWKPYIFWMHII